MRLCEIGLKMINYMIDHDLMNITGVSLEHYISHIVCDTLRINLIYDFRIQLFNILSAFESALEMETKKHVDRKTT